MKRLKIKKRKAILILNILIILFLIAYVVVYTIDLKSSSVEREKNKFIHAVDIANQEIAHYMDNAGNIVKDWAHYVNSREYTAEEIINNVGTLNSDSNSMVQLIYADTMNGISSAAPANDPDNYEVYYWDYYDLSLQLKEYRETTDGNDYCITVPFSNCINSKQSVAYASLVKVYNTDGSSQDAFIMRVMPVSMLKESHDFNSLYNNAQISMINSHGDYVFRASTLKSSNFYDFLQYYNDMTYPEVYALRDSINASENSGCFIMKDSKGEDTLFAYSAKSCNDRLVIGSIRVADLDYDEVQWSLLIVTALCFSMLIVINTYYFYTMRSRLKQSLAELKAANSAKTRFLSSMSHDIRTPMNAVIGMTTVALHNIDDKAHVTECLRKISLAGNHLLTLINDILDISQVESGKLTLNPIVFSLAESAEDLVNILYPQAEDKKLKCDVVISNANQDYLYADKLRLNQIWINIISNAVKYTPSGGNVTVRFSEEDIPDAPSKVRLIFSVSDTGIGMSQEYVKTIFEPFTREKDSRIDTIQGSGLGMAITKQIVDLLNGKIDVESEEGKGSTFTVTLDIERAEAPVTEKKFKDINVLLVGSRSVLESTRQFLYEFGADNDIAETTEQAVSLISEKSYQLIIIDRQMSDLSCIGTAKTLKDHFGSSSPIMMISAFDRSDIEAQAMQAGVKKFIGRPIFKSALYETLADLFSESCSKHNDAAGDNSDLAGAHLLIAEDNDLNWEIVNDLLSIYNITSDRAVNGSECVRMLEEADENTYTMIFMDIQMPILNGYGAARKIRSLDVSSKANIPIVAMTADAFAGDVAACLDAGMNGHIAKPVDLNIIISEIRKYYKT